MRSLPLSSALAAVLVAAGCGGDANARAGAVGGTYVQRHPTGVVALTLTPDSPAGGRARNVTSTAGGDATMREGAYSVVGETLYIRLDIGPGAAADYATRAVAHGDTLTVLGDVGGMDRDFVRQR